MEIEETKATEMKTDLVSPKADVKEPRTAESIQSWLISYLVNLLEIDSNQVKVNIPLERYGLDSAAAVGLAGDLEEWIGFELDITLLYDYPTIEELAERLAQECAKF